MQQKFFSANKKGKDGRMLNFEGKCGKMPIDKFRKFLFSQRKSFCEIRKIVKIFNDVLIQKIYSANKLPSYVKMMLCRYCYANILYFNDTHTIRLNLNSEEKIRSVNDFLTIGCYSLRCHINEFLKMLRGVQSPVPRWKRTPVSMFKKSIYIINVFINQATDALRCLSINKIGDYVYNTIFKKELLVLFLIY